VSRTVARVAEARGVEPSVLGAQTADNAKRLFSLPI
jgi:Tat protein secretion system quality control protein TatD with DNase activity